MGDHRNQEKKPTPNQMVSLPVSVTGVRLHPFAGARCLGVFLDLLSPLRFHPMSYHFFSVLYWLYSKFISFLSCFLWLTSVWSALFPVCKHFVSKLPDSGRLPFQSILHGTEGSSCLERPGKEAPPKNRRRESCSGRKPGNKSCGFW